MRRDFSGGDCYSAFKRETKPTDEANFVWLVYEFSQHAHKLTSVCLKKKFMLCDMSGETDKLCKWQLFCNVK